jgi:site-specific DNA recombinase
MESVPHFDRNPQQEVLNRRAENKQHRIKHDFTFTSFIRCGHCGCQLVGELKKGRYVYYHCTGHRGKCPEPYTREGIMAAQFAASLRDLVIPREVLTWLSEVVSGSDINERAAREKTVNRFEEQYRRIQAKLEVMYEDKLEGRISAEFYDRKAKELQAQASELLRRVNDVRAATPAPVAASST